MTISQEKEAEGPNDSSKLDLENTNTSQHKSQSSSDDEKAVKGKEEKKKDPTMVDKIKEKCVKSGKGLIEDLKKNNLWQHILKCSIATTLALITCLIPAIASAYGPAVFLSAVASVYAHTSVTFASYISDLIYKTNVEDAHAFRAVILAISFIVHGYLRSVFPRFFVGILLFLLAVVIQMTTPIFTFDHMVATAFLYPFLTGIGVCTLVNVLIFPEFSSGKVAVVTVDGLKLALETLKDATEFFVLPNEDVVKKEPAAKEDDKSEKPKSKSADGVEKDEKKDGKAKKGKKDKKKAKESSKDGEPEAEKADEKGKGEGEEKEEDPLKKLVAAKDQLRKALGASKAILKETSFEICYSCLPPAKLHPISSRGLEALVMSLLTLIGACETKHMVLAPVDKEEEKDIKSDDESDKSDDSDQNSLREKLENIRPKREAEAADEEFLRHLLQRVDEPLTALRGAIRQGMNALMACVELSCDVPVTVKNMGRKPKGIPLKEIDIYADAIEKALEDFDKRTREALHTAAEEASQEEEVEFDTLPREEIFLVSSFLLNLRLAAQTTLTMLKEGRDLVEEYDALKGKRSFHLPDFKSKKWLFGGDSEQNEALDSGERENVSRYREVSGGIDNADERAMSQQRTQRVVESKKKPAGSDAPAGKKSGAKKDKNKDKSKGKKKGGKQDEQEEEEKERKPLALRIRGAFADFIDWFLTSGHLHYAFKLAVGGMLLSWPAFVPEFADFYYNYRGVWIVIIYILVFENSVGTSIQIFAYRTVGTIAGSIWGYAAWSAGSGNPYVIVVMLYFGFLVGYYVQLNTRYIKAGMVLTISMVVISVGTEIEYIPGAVPGTALENFLKRTVAMIIGGSAAVIIQTVIFPVKARVKLVETVGLAVLKINEMESALAFGVDQTTNLSDIRNENAVKAFYKARKKAEVSLAAASAYLSVSTQEPRIKGSFANDKLVYKEIIYVLRQIIDRMENVLQLRIQLGSALLENYYVYVYKYRRNVAAAITITLFAVHEALTSKLPLPQYFPSARLAQLRMVNRVRQILIESVSAENQKEGQEAEDSKRKILRVEFMTYNASSAALEQVIEWLEELVDLTKLLRGAAEFRAGLLSRPTYREWVRQISIGGEVQDPPPSKVPEKEERPASRDAMGKIAALAKRQQQEEDSSAIEEGDNELDALKRVQSRHREARASRRVSQTTALPRQVELLRRAARGL
ncbi:hypothetical protein ABW19_dt0206905 [Dactylella cylindrospora]|nr:hypothetical protein ABW19_dt0206905 [Dactylella cylindrospora]